MARATDKTKSKITNTYVLKLLTLLQKYIDKIYRTSYRSFLNRIRSISKRYRTPKQSNTQKSETKGK